MFYHRVMFKDFIGKFKKKVEVKKIDTNQPVRIWSFVIILNLVGFLGLIILNSYKIGPGIH